LPSALAVELFLQAVQALVPDFGATEFAGQGWQASGEEVAAALKVPAGHLVQPGSDSTQMAVQSCMLVVADCS
jgi:hypothetical protein